MIYGVVSLKNLGRPWWEGPYRHLDTFGHIPYHIKLSETLPFPRVEALRRADYELIP